MAYINRHHPWSSASSASISIAIDKGIERGLRCSGGSSVGGSSSSSSGYIDTLGILGSTRVIYSAVILASGVTVAVENALTVGSRADVIGDCQGIFSCVGADAVAACAVVGQCFLMIGVSGTFLSVEMLRLTAEQVFVSGEPEAPRICRQRRGHADVWELHQPSKGIRVSMMVIV